MKRNIHSMHGLTLRSLNGKKSSSVKWNFQKYLIDPEGKLIDYFFSITKPFSSKITKHFKVLKHVRTIFKKKTAAEKLQEKYKKVMEEGFKLQSINRSDSDQKYLEADAILKEIEQLKA